MNTTTESLELPSTAPAIPVLKVTENAANRVKTFAKGNKEAEGKHFRIYIQGGGCSGFSYGFKFDDQQKTDNTFQAYGITILVDPASMEQLKGSTVDWVENFKGAGFVVQNPNATGGCGCGKSFSA
jgi:iron-sulfur cluster insertion protein